MFGKHKAKTAFELDDGYESKYTHGFSVQGNKAREILGMALHSHLDSKKAEQARQGLIPAIHALHVVNTVEYPTH